MYEDKLIENDDVCVESNFTPPTVIRVIPKEKGKLVRGVTTVGDDVFVVRFVTQQKIEVYNAKTFTLQRHITVPELGSPFALVACPYNNCLYAPDNSKDSVHRVELSGSNAVIRWPVAHHPAGLSVNDEQDVLVVSAHELKLQIFTTHGTLLQNIELQGDIKYPSHAIQLPTGQFLVSYSSLSDLHCVSLVGSDGAVVRSYGGQKGSELNQMDCPAGLSVDREGRVLVADRFNNRLLVIDDESLSTAHKMSVNVDDGLQGPYSLWFDQSCRRLCIGEWRGGRVIVIDNLQDFRVSEV